MNSGVFIHVAMLMFCWNQQSSDGRIAPPAITNPTDRAIVRPDLARGFVEILPAGGEPRDTLRLPLPNQVSPELHCVFDREPDGRTTYDYRLANAAGAKQAITGLEFVLPERVAVTEIRSLGNWLYSKNPYRNSTVQHALPGARVGNIFWWSPGIDISRRIRPGEDESAFAFTSDALPGIVRAYVFGESDTREEARILNHLPPEVAHEVARYMQAEYSAQNLFTVGPFFPRATGRREIVRTYLNRFNEPDFVRDKRLDPAFLKELRNRLASYEQQLGVDSDGAAKARGLTRICGILSGHHGHPFERELSQAISQSLCSIP
jgi:hypothetical protein